MSSSSYVHTSTTAACVLTSDTLPTCNIYLSFLILTDIMSSSSLAMLCAGCEYDKKKEEKKTAVRHIGGALFGERYTASK